MALTSIGIILSILQTTKAQISLCTAQADQSLCCLLLGINAISDEMVDTACVIVYILAVLRQNISCGVILSNCSSVQTHEGLRLSMTASLDFIGYIKNGPKHQDLPSLCSSPRR